MNAQDYFAQRDHRFIAGLAWGALVGAGLAIWFGPRLAAGVQQASHRVSRAVDDLTSAGRGVRDEAAEAVARGAQDVERYARSVQS